ncbi:(Fe-S)-binding protein [Methanosarcina sp. 2.H.T.1A.6]|uniref:DUF362 domain-containing protein n=1 Tax=unclassified Methanosarcina TaxID=2644672 RepID=UPI000621B8DC|nr:MULTISPECIES: DUF362 domain-containing protein [unclassified Methanosarcina]KKG14784.1 (Fe-S)-binding protein [Methanosarcina sp. 2.H.T.1A.3]KKG23916.1 (Fe-S)-binding protein [Methanosarcina sp. 2.H.T.1A.6]KKG26446.1 (Fe-S)-binding protein [Methanosarcina sp. 2.H.T.1A.8]
MNRVSIVSCPDYSDTKEAIARALGLLGGIEKIIDPGDRVLLKPNLLSASPPEAATTTHPSMVAAMCEFVLSAGGKPVVGDGAGISRPGATAKALKVSGIEEAARKAGAQIVNFETAGFTLVEVPEPLQFRKLYIANPVLEADVIISLPKLKTHELTYYTGAVKNFFGVLPLKCRKEIHLLGNRDLFGEAVADVYSVVRPNFAVMDGVVGMEGNGPSHGKPVNSGVILASPDCVSLDIVAAELIGFDPLKIPTTAGALKKGFGNQCPVVVGTPLKEVKKKFKPSSGGISTSPAFLKRSLGKYYTINPRINQRKCTQCGACYLNCSPGAVERLEDGTFKINPEKCILCYCCRELCPNDAVEIKKSLLAQFLTETEDLIRRA